MASIPTEEEIGGTAESSYHEAVLNFKRDILRAALAQANGNQTRAADALGLQRTYLSRLLGQRYRTQFSHGICPTCVRQLHPDYLGEAQ